VVHSRDVKGAGENHKVSLQTSHSFSFNDDGAVKLSPQIDPKIFQKSCYRIRKKNFDNFLLTD